jgi:hypothetical protein
MTRLSCRACSAETGFVIALDRLVHLAKQHVGRVVDQDGNFADRLERVDLAPQPIPDDEEVVA